MGIFYICIVFSYGYGYEYIEYIRVWWVVNLRFIFAKIVYGYILEIIKIIFDINRCNSNFYRYVGVTSEQDSTPNHT